MYSHHKERCNKKPSGIKMTRTKYKNEHAKFESFGNIVFGHIILGIELF